MPEVQVISVTNPTHIFRISPMRDIKKLFYVEVIRTKFGLECKTGAGNDDNSCEFHAQRHLRAKHLLTHRTSIYSVRKIKLDGPETTFTTFSSNKDINLMVSTEAKYTSSNNTKIV